MGEKINSCYPKYAKNSPLLQIMDTLFSLNGYFLSQKFVLVTVLKNCMERREAKQQS